MGPSRHDAPSSDFPSIRVELFEGTSDPVAALSHRINYRIRVSEIPPAEEPVRLIKTLCLMDLHEADLLPWLQASSQDLKYLQPCAEPDLCEAICRHAFVGVLGQKVELQYLAEE